MIFKATAVQNKFYGQNSAKIAKLKFLYHKNPEVDFLVWFGVQETPEAEISYQKT